MCWDVLAPSSIFNGVLASWNPVRRLRLMSFSAICTFSSAPLPKMARRPAASAASVPSVPVAKAASVVSTPFVPVMLPDMYVGFGKHRGSHPLTAQGDGAYSLWVLQHVAGSSSLEMKRLATSLINVYYQDEGRLHFRSSNEVAYDPRAKPAPSPVTGPMSSAGPMSVSDPPAPVTPQRSANPGLALLDAARAIRTASSHDVTLARALAPSIGRIEDMGFLESLVASHL